MTGQTISHYRIVEKLGGSCQDEVAKVPQALSRFQREAKAASVGLPQQRRPSALSAKTE